MATAACVPGRFWLEFTKSQDRIMQGPIPSNYATRVINTSQSFRQQYIQHYNWSRLDVVRRPGEKILFKSQQLDGCIVWNVHNTVFGSKRSAVCALAVYFLHSTRPSVTWSSLAACDWL